MQVRSDAGTLCINIVNKVDMFIPQDLYYPAVVKTWPQKRKTNWRIVRGNSSIHSDLDETIIHFADLSKRRQL